MMSLELALRFYEIDVDLAAKQAAKRVAKHIQEELAPFNLSRHPLRLEYGVLIAGATPWFEMHQRFAVERALRDLGEVCAELPEPVQQHLAKEFP